MSGSELSDTSRAAARVQIQLLREATPTRRFELALSLSQTTRELALAALRRRHPELPEQEIRLRFAEVHFGKELAQRVRDHLERQA